MNPTPLLPPAKERRCFSCQQAGLKLDIKKDFPDGQIHHSHTAVWEE